MARTIVRGEAKHLCRDVLHLNPKRVDVTMVIVLLLAIADVWLPASLHSLTTIATIAHVGLWWLHD